MSQSKRPFDLVVSENLEVLAMGVAMALILKFFAVEAFAIPTGSMQPTMLGDRKAGIHDRIVADKLVTCLRPPHRWEVMIFRYPLDERGVYVKRIVGLPGETLRIAGGDLWVDGRIARKPDHVNDSVLKTAFGPGPIEIGRAFEAHPVDAVRLGEGGRSARFESDGELSLRRDVADEYDHGYDPDWNIVPHVSATRLVPDLELALDVVPDPGARQLALTFEADDETLTVEIPVEGGPSPARLVRMAADGTETAEALEGARALPAGTSTRVVARNVDRRLVVLVDGEEWLRRDDDRAGPRPERPTRARLSLSLRGGGTVEDVSVRRDIFYLPSTDPRAEGPAQWAIPPRHYFGLGDNTQASHDSRTWETQTYRLPDGREVTGNWFPPPRIGVAPPDSNPQLLPDGRLRFVDVHGDVYRFPRDTPHATERQPAPFIHERYLLGKAVAVWWPVVPFRWKLIR